MSLLIKITVLLITTINFNESASLKEKEDHTLDMFKQDISKVGGAIENLTFDVLKTVLEDDSESGEESTTTPSTDEATTTPKNPTTLSPLLRKIRSTQDEDLNTICQKRYCPSRQEQSENYKELKSEVKKMHDLIELLGIHQKVNKMQSREEPPQIHEPIHELASIKSSILEAVKTLNHTRELILLQRQKTSDMEDEIRLQHAELNHLKKIVNIILKNNGTTIEEVVGSEEPLNQTQISARASEFSELKKFMKTLPNDEEPEEDDIQSKVLDLEKRLKKKKRQEALDKELKMLQKLMDGGVESKENDEEKLLKQLQKAFKTPTVESKSDSADINNLQDLQNAINRIRPKENNDVDIQQFQTMLNKLINNPNGGNNAAAFRPPPASSSSGLTLTPQQVSEIRNKLSFNQFQPQTNANNNFPWWNLYDNHFQSNPYNSGYRPPAAPPVYAPQEVANSQNFFPAQQYSPPAYYPQPNYNVATPEKPAAYPSPPPETPPPSPKYQDDLRTQIDGLQAAIDGLNYPGYAQKPEDKAIIDDLEHQIGELRSIVGNLNQNYESTGNSYRRRRSSENNQVEDNDSSKAIEQITELLGSLMTEDGNKAAQKMTPEDGNQAVERKMTPEEIQEQIDSLKNQLGTNSTSRAAGPPPNYNNYYNNYPQQYFDYETQVKDKKELFKQKKTDIFTEIVAKIIDKVLAATPVIVQKLFNFSLGELTRNDYEDYDVTVLFKHLGVLAYIPVIILRIVKGFSAFFKILRKNSFFKNFFVPISIVGLMGASVLFLVWWLQPDEKYPQISYDYSNNYNPSPSYSKPNTYANNDYYSNNK